LKRGEGGVEAKMKSFAFWRARCAIKCRGNRGAINKRRLRRASTLNTPVAAGPIHFLSGRARPELSVRREKSKKRNRGHCAREHEAMGGQ